MSALVEVFGCGCIGIRTAYENTVLFLQSCDHNSCSPGFNLCFSFSNRILPRNLEPSVCRPLSPQEMEQLERSFSSALSHADSMLSITGHLSYLITKNEKGQLHTNPHFARKEHQE